MAQKVAHSSTLYDPTPFAIPLFGGSNGGERPCIVLVKRLEHMLVHVLGSVHVRLYDAPAPYTLTLSPLVQRYLYALQPTLAPISRNEQELDEGVNGMPQIERPLLIFKSRQRSFDGKHNWSVENRTPTVRAPFPLCTVVERGGMVLECICGGKPEKPCEHMRHLNAFLAQEALRQERKSRFSWRIEQEVMIQRKENAMYKTGCQSECGVVAQSRKTRKPVLDRIERLLASPRDTTFALASLFNDCLLFLARQADGVVGLLLCMKAKRRNVPMSTIHESPGEFLTNIIARCNVLNERYGAVSALLLEHPTDTPHPELSGQLTAYTIAHGNITHLSEQLERMALSGWNVSKVVGAITHHVRILGSVRSHALRRSTRDGMSEGEKACALTTSDILQAVLGEVGEDLLAPALVRFVQTAPAMSLARLSALGRQSDEAACRQAEIAQVLRFLSEERGLDPCYGAIADGLVTLLTPEKAAGDKKRNGSDRVCMYVRSLSTFAFVSFTAQLFAEYFAGLTVQTIDLISLSSAAQELVNRLQAGKGEI